MTLRRPLLKLLLLALALVGFGSELRRHHRRHREAFERHLAALCVEAAKAGGSAPPDPAW